MRRVTSFTAFRGLIAAAVIVLLAGLILLMSPFIVIILAGIFAVCVLRSDSWGECWEDFSGGLYEMCENMASFFRYLAKLWVTEETPIQTDSAEKEDNNEDGDNPGREVAG